ncbi:hypothetical protein QE152_g35022 [Popillia japonica]|uniref:Uncharacterized protein n=1 Tax=Popillia japonica TaxID=7064 RepID=A0AAW1IRU5_POPJA
MEANQFLKVAWKNVLKDHYHRSGFKSVDKVLFPSLLKKTIEAGCSSRSNTIGGFSGAGIYPLNKEKILEKAIESTVFDEALYLTKHLKEIRSCRLNTVSDTNTDTPVSSTVSAGPFSPEQLEASILSVLQRQQKPITSGKRTKVRRKFTECLTSAEVVEGTTAEAKMKQQEKEKQLKEKQKKVIKKRKTAQVTARTS